MSNVVNTKIQAFYNKGYRDAMNDVNYFIDVARQHFGDLKVEQDLTIDKFLAIMLDELNKTYGRSMETHNG